MKETRTQRIERLLTNLTTQENAYIAYGEEMYPRQERERQEHARLRRIARATELNLLAAYKS